MNDASNNFSKHLSSGKLVLILGDLASSGLYEQPGPVTLDEAKVRLLRVAGLGNASPGRTSLSEALDFARGIDTPKANKVLRACLASNGKVSPQLWRILSGPFERIYDLGGQGGFAHLLSHEAKSTLHIVGEDEPPLTTDSKNQIVSLAGSFDTPDGLDFTGGGIPNPARGAWYRQFCTDLAVRPIVVVCGQAHDELWELLSARPGAEVEEIRAAGFWVSDTEDDLTQVRLSKLGMAALGSTVRAFASEMLAAGRQDVIQGRKELARRRLQDHRLVGATDVSALIEAKGTDSWDFLRGYDPQWSDVSSRRMPRLHFASKVRNEASLAEGQRNIVLLKGRAGSGKTATLMRLATEYEAAGSRVVWIDREANQSVSEIIDSVTEAGPDVVLVDNVDLFGERTDEALRRFNRNGQTLVIATVRTTQIWAVTNPGRYKRVSADDPLTDGDLDVLLKSLETAGLLGKLVGVRPREARVEHLRRMCERDLLAALIEVVTGVPFDERVASEFAQLDDAQKSAYSIICFASAKVFESPWLPEDHLLQMMGGAPPFGRHLQSVHGLVDASLVVRSEFGLRPRHRAIADAVLRGASMDPDYLADVVERMLYFYSSSGSDRLPTNHPNHRRLVSLLSHTLMRDSGLPKARVRAIYASVQPYLAEDKHFWLQRGAYEVERGDLDLADSYLESARACLGGEDDYKITTEWGLMRLSKACAEPTSSTLQERAFLALVALRDVALVKGRSSPHTFVVMVREGTRWLSTEDSLGNVKRLEAISMVKNACDVGEKVCADNSEVVKTIVKYRPQLEALRGPIDSGPSNNPAFPL